MRFFGTRKSQSSPISLADMVSFKFGHDMWNEVSNVVMVDYTYAYGFFLEEVLTPALLERRHVRVVDDELRQRRRQRTYDEMRRMVDPYVALMMYDAGNEDYLKRITAAFKAAHPSDYADMVSVFKGKSTSHCVSRMIKHFARLARIVHKRRLQS